jgi:uncharacterized integral membrane protein
VKTAAVLVLILAAVGLAAQNATAVTITVLTWRFEASLALVIAMCVAIGFIAGVLLLLPRLYRMRSRERQLRAQLADLGAPADLADLREEKRKQRSELWRS